MKNKKITQQRKQLSKEKLCESKDLHLQCKEYQKEIEVKNAALVQRLLDLNTLMSQVEANKKEIENNIILNIETMILPLVAKVKSKPDSAEHLELLEKSLHNIMSNFGVKIASKLTPREREVIAFIKEGLTNKEISKVLNLSQRTIDRHRQKIRGKLGLTRSSISLRAWLMDNK